jgi:hypothetical protein
MTAEKSIQQVADARRAGSDRPISRVIAEVRPILMGLRQRDKLA